ncbi:MAG TPA: class I SAM-dependent methyltransferase [Polyangiaceae bacterium]|nr:class I SAM-dependent methyltransferase [Polyangiaceae bacterium]
MIHEASRANGSHSNGQSVSRPSAPPTTSAVERIRRIAADRVSIQLSAFSWYRYEVVDPLLVAGPVRFLNIGTGGGVETLRLLRKGNHVTTIEIDPDTAARTRERVERNGFGDRHVGHVGHVLDVPVTGLFDGVLMCEVLEHIKDDFKALQRVSQWLAPGGRLILTTPTASWGQVLGDEVTVVEDGGHVRVGYDGPELDAMFADIGLITLKRFTMGHRLVCWHQRLERVLYSTRVTRPVGRGVSFLSRPLMPLLDAVPGRPLCQVTLAVKRHA